MASWTFTFCKTQGPSLPRSIVFYRQYPKGTFKDVTVGSGLGVAGYSMGVAIGDVNNDGRPDVLLTQYGSIKLFLNLGEGKFEDVTAQAGLANPLWGVVGGFSSTMTGMAGSIWLWSTTWITMRKKNASHPRGLKPFVPHLSFAACAASSSAIAALLLAIRNCQSRPSPSRMSVSTQA